jgi:molybdopterin converting factor small subunit
VADAVKRGAPMRIKVQFYSYFKDLTGTAGMTEEMSQDATIAELLQKLFVKYPKLAAMERSMLVAVGVDYQPRDYALKENDDVSLFPPVQGG